MANPVLVGGFPDNYDLTIEGGIGSAVQNYIVDAEAKYPSVFPEFMDVVDSTKKSDHISELGGIPRPPLVGENQDFPVASPVEGYDTTIVNYKYAQVIEISLEARNDDFRGVFDNIQLQIEFHMQAAQEGLDVLAASVLTGGFATACPDGQFLFDTDHPTSPSIATTLSNLITTQLDPAGIALKEMITKIKTNGKDLAGHQLNMQSWRLVVPPALYGNALQSCYALYGTPFSISQSGIFRDVVGGSSNPTPMQTGQIFRTSTTTGSTVEVVENPYLGSGWTSGSDVKWYAICNPAMYKGRHSLRMNIREKPQAINISIDQDNMALKIPFYYRANAAAIGWRHGFASNGTT